MSEVENVMNTLFYRLRKLNHLLEDNNTKYNRAIVLDCNSLKEMEEYGVEIWHSRDEKLYALFLVGTDGSINFFHRSDARELSSFIKTMNMSYEVFC